MDFALSPEQRARCDRLREAVRSELVAGAAGTREKWRAAGRLGLLGLCVPERDGGRGLGAFDTALCLEALGSACDDMGLVFAVSAHLLACVRVVSAHATAETRDELLPRLLSGEWVAANAMTEDAAGSDLSALATRARRDGHGYVLDGEKSYASNGPDADVAVTYAVTDPDAGFLGVTGFAVPTALDGVHRGDRLPKLGLESCAAGRIRFDGCTVPERYRLGAEGEGLALFQLAMAWERACLFAGYLGLMQRQLEACLDHARTRRQFGRPVARFQAVSHRIVGMAHRLEAARLLLYRACWTLDAGDDAAAAAAHAKLAVSEAAVANSLDAVALFGARGAGTVETQLRDCVPGMASSGTPDIQRELIARDLGL